MKKREVKFSLDARGNVLPTVPQFAGIKGEHCATSLVITMLKNGQSTDEGMTFYQEGEILRLVFSLGDGAVLSSDMLQSTLVDQGMMWVLDYALPRTVTVPSGQLSVRLVSSALDKESGEEVQMYQSQEMVLYFDDAAVENGTPFWRGVSEMLAGTVSACETARSLRDETATIRNETKVMFDALAAGRGETGILPGYKSPFCYKGKTDKHSLLTMKGMQDGDVWLCGDEYIVSVYLENRWHFLNIGEATVSETSEVAVSGAAVYRFVNETILGGEW